jgi:hypothetical protein
MSVYTPEGGDALVGLLFQTQHGAFARVDKRWQLIAPNDPRFDGLVVNDVLPSHSEEVLAAFDSGAGRLSDVQGLVSETPLEAADYAEQDN